MTSSRFAPPSPTVGITSLGDAPTSENAALIAAMEQLHGAALLPINEADPSPKLLVVPKGMEVQSVKKYLDEYRLKPERRRGTARLTDAQSFVDHINRFASDKTTVVFVDPDRNKPTFTAVYDYHPGGPDAADANWLQHRAVYAPALSDQWKAWLGNNGKSMPQGEFAQFIEDHVTDLIVPNLDDPHLKTFAGLVGGRFAEPSDLVALSRGLQINVGSVVKNAITLGTGEISVQYEEVHRDGAGQPIQIPNLFQIAIPVFYAGTLYKLSARLRYRSNGGSLSWSYLLVQPELAFDDAIGGVKENLIDNTNADVFLGAPEA